jgi:PBSX family phage terminase large subunit
MEKNIDDPKIILKYKPLPKQIEFHKSGAKFRAYIGGLGSGKTKAGSVETIDFLVTNPGALFLIGAPTYKMLNDATKRTFFELLNPDMIRKYNKSDENLILKNDAEVLFRSCETSADVDKLRGPNLAGFWLDEAPYFPGEAWKVLIGRLRQDKMNLKAWITGTPRGFNWVYKTFLEFGKLKPEYKIINASTYENTYLPQEYVKDLEESYSGQFKKQELMGEFVGHEGLVYLNFSRFKHLIKKEKIPNFVRVIAGIDFGFTNPSVCLFAGIDSDGRVYIIKEIYERRLLINEFIETIKKELKELNLTVENFYCDPSQPALIQEFNNAGLSALAANNDILPGINKVSSYFDIAGDGKARLYINERCFNTIVELETYRYSDKKEDKEEKETPLKVYDHAMDALRYLINSLEKESMMVLTDSSDIFG